MRFTKWALLLLTISLLASCGGDDGSTNNPESNSALTSQAKSTLQSDLAALEVITDEQASQIIASANQQLKDDGLLENSNATEVLPSLLEGTMEGIGTLSLTEAELINSLVEQSITSIMGLLATEPTTTRQLRSFTRSFTELHSLLELLVEKAVSSLEKTKLPVASLGTGVGKVVRAVVTNLDKAKIENMEVSSAVDKVVGKSMQSLEKLPVAVREGSVEQITEHAIGGAGALAAKVSSINLGESIGKVVSAVVGNLDKANVSSSESSTKVEQVISKGMESLGALEQTELGDSVEQIAQGGIRGFGELAAKDNNIILGESVGRVVSAVVGNLDKANVSSSESSTKVEQVISKGMESLGALEQTELGDSVEQIAQGGIQGAGNLADKDQSFALDESVGKVLSAIVSNLNKAKVDSEELNLKVEQVIKKGMESLDQLPDIVVGNSVKKLTEGAISGAGSLAAKDYGINLGSAVSIVAQSATEGLAKLTVKDENTREDFQQQVKTSLMTGLDGLRGDDAKFNFAEMKAEVDSGVSQGAASLASACDFSGRKVLIGTSVVGYLSEVVPFGSECSAETRICSEGVLNGVNSYASCQVTPPSGCSFGEKDVAHGSSFTAYLSETVPFGESCQSEQRDCSDGTLSGSYNFELCLIEAPDGTRPPESMPVPPDGTRPPEGTPIP